MPISPYLEALRRKIGHEAVLMPGVAVLIFNERGEILLHRTRDDGLWHTIGGAMDPDEEPAQTAIREAKEETGLDITPERVVSVYAGPCPTYDNGDRVLFVTIAFACRVGAGARPYVADDESLEMRFFALEALPELWEWDRRAILQAALGEPAARFYP